MSCSFRLLIGFDGSPEVSDSLRTAALRIPTAVSSGEHVPCPRPEISPPFGFDMDENVQPQSIGADSAHRAEMSAPRLDPAAPLLFVINAGAGALDLEAKRAVIRRTLAEHGRKGELLTCAPADLARVATEATAEAAACGTAVVAVGGDGSLSTVAQAAHAAGCPMGVIPYGTFNYFARTHGIATEPDTAARQLMAASPMPVQVGAINGRVFLVNASLGVYPELLQDREAWKARFGRSRWVAFVAACATLLRAQRRLRLHIETATSVRDVQTLTLFVGNNRLQLQQVGVDPEDTLDGTPGDGSMAALMLRPIGTMSMLGLMLHGAMGRLGEAAGVETFEFRHMVVKPRLAPRRKKFVVAFDGEVTRMRAPIDIRVLDKPLYLLQALGTEGKTSLPEAAE
ncbi:diacylglycerol/lipid kinase family protein [Thauera sp. 28]|uniref:diacylglycerol/lipid kinase family protein n=1 Tax=Thauera sp. 28 TaxID=303682 RepID=UPI001E3747A2|nr:diacylglycerol kinase family protein [Thauera sp. 28]